MCNKKLPILLSLPFLCLLAFSCSSAVRVTDLSLEGMEGYSATDEAIPRFSWKLKSSKRDVVQESYRILVATAPSLLSPEQADAWDSGEVNSDCSILVPYAGRELSAGERLWWKVISKTSKGEAQSEPSYWDMGLLNNSNWKARWIGGAFPDDDTTGYTCVNARYLRKDFELAGKVERALLNISGLGLYEAELNGKPATGGQVLSPTVSDYDKTVYYNVLDVTDLLKTGSNAIGVILGNGRYQTPRTNKGGTFKSVNVPDFRHFGLPCLLLQLEITYADGSVQTIVSDDSWKITEEGPIRGNNELDGETYDARKEIPLWSSAGFDDSSWLQASLIHGPRGKLVAQPNPNIAIQETISPKSIVEKDGKYIVDLGQNMVGWLQFKGSGLAEGDTLSFRFAETLNPDTTLYVANLRSVRATDRYIAKGPDAFVWHPSFTYHGFRFVEISGLKVKPKTSDIEGQVFYDKMTTSGSFTCSNDVVNTVYRNAFWGIRGNYRGMPTDCPQRDERMGWTGDRAGGCYGESYVFNNHLLYSKWLQDLEDAQREDGSVPDVAPAYWPFYNDGVTWPAAFITAADMVYNQFGDSRPIERHYSAMKKWFCMIKEKYTDEDGIIWINSYGDWCMPPESPELIHSKDPSRKTDGPVLSTPYFIRICPLMAYFCEIAGHPEDKAFYEETASTLTEAFNRKYYNEEGYYANNTVTANIQPLFIGMVPEGNEEKVFGHIVEKTEKDFDGHVSTGVIGIQYLMRGLSEFGAPDLALKIASNTDYPSWGYMAENGATTIWELWNGDTADPAMNSGNHVMLLGDLILWEYSYLGGIRSLEPGFKTIELKPLPIDGLDWVDCSYESAHGTIVSSWKTEGQKFIWKIEIPANTSAKVHIPGTPDSSKLSALGVTAAEDGTYFFPSGKYKIESVL